MAWRLYTVVRANSGPIGDFDFLELTPTSTKPIRLRRLRITQTSELMTDEQNFWLTVIRGHTTSGSGGLAVTPHPLTTGIAAAGFTVETYNANQASGGSPAALVEEAWNTRSGLDIAFSPEEAPGAVNERLVVRSSGISNPVTFGASFWIEELG